MTSSFRRHSASTIPFETLRLIARLSGETGIELHQAFGPDRLTSTIGSLVHLARNPIRIHGARAEELFVYMAVALGSVIAVKREETSDLVIAAKSAVTVPDFRVVLADGTEILVEVKNFHTSTGHRPQKREYLEGLAHYGKIFNRPVYLAVYWSKWRIWTLHSVEELMVAVERGVVPFTFAEAYGRSQMRLLGDLLLGTRFPLTLRFDVSAQVVKRASRKSEQLVRIDDVKMFVAGVPINVERDRDIAFGLMMHGRWEESQDVSLDGETIRAVEYSYSPVDPDPTAGFAPVASLSSLASAQFNSLTTSGAKVTRLRPRDLPAPPYPTSRDSYLGTDLPLWKLVLEPGTDWSTQFGSRPD